MPGLSWFSTGPEAPVLLLWIMARTPVALMQQCHERAAGLVEVVVMGRRETQGFSACPQFGAQFRPVQTAPRSSAEAVNYGS